MRQLAEELSIGLKPVRDAHRLASDELVQLCPRMATRVVPISIERITEMFEVRTRLEALAARRATMCLSGSDVRRLTRYQENMERTGAAVTPQVVTRGIRNSTR